jgi:phenylpropionate dioxygenase-like ring-hydroxylating dioxygenase large terminal subunit
MGDQRSIDELISSHKPGWSLEQRFYTDPEIYELELEHIVTKNWTLAGHQSQLPKVGDFKVFNLAKESAILVRTDEGEIAGFANVCRHRGSLVCLEQSGHARSFRCPYHGWVYGIDGALKTARDMPESFQKQELGLHPISVEVLQGLIFVSFSSDPPSLQGAQRDLAEPLALFDVENLKVAAHRSYAIPANWKLAVENYQECYHCATSHPEYAKIHTLMLETAKRDKAQERMLERMPACGLAQIEFDCIDTKARAGEQGYGYRRMALFEGCKTGSKSGQAVAPLLGALADYDGGASDVSVGHCSFLLIYSDHVVAYVFSPIDHLHSQCEIYWMVRGDAVQGQDYDLEELVWLWDITTAADKEIIVNNSKGVNSRFYQPGPFSKMEQAESNYVDWILQELKHRREPG